MAKKVLIEGMSCGHCVKRVTNALSELTGVSDVKVDLATKTAEIEGNPSDEDIKAAVDDAGYDVVSIETV